MSEEAEAKFRKAVANTPYRPSNGTEGEFFFEGWCSKCWHDRVTRLGEERWDEGCKLIANSMAYNVGDPEYPKEWVYDAEGSPTCTKFRDETRGDPGEPLDPNAAVRDLFASRTPGSGDVE